MAGEGQQELQNLSSVGFSTDEIAAWQNQRRSQLIDAGFNDAEIGDYFGQPIPNDKPIEDHFHQAISQAATVAKGDGTTEAKPFTMEDAVAAGWQQSVTGLMLRGKMPDTTLPENNTWYQRIAANVASMAGDLPAMGAGFVIGGGSTVAETGPFAAIPATGAAFAMPAALRATMMDAYSKGEYHSASDFIQRASGILLNTAKAYVTGAVTGGAGMAAKPALAAAGLEGTALNLGVASSEVGAMVTTSKALEGQLPNASDFTDAAVMLAGFKAVPFLAGKTQEGINAAKQSPVFSTIADKTDAVAGTLRDIFAKTGKSPSEVAMDAVQNPTIHQDIMANPGEIPSAYKPLVDPYFAPKEPKAPAAPEAPEPGSLASAQKTILDKIEVGGKDDKPTMTFDDLYTRTVDSMNPLKNAVDAMTNGEKLPASQNPYTLARLTRGFYGKADQFLQNSPYDFSTYKNTGESLKSILAPFKDDLDGVRAYITASRAKELEGRGITSGFDPVAVDKVLTESGDKYSDVGQKLVDFSNNVTKYLRDSGVLSKDAYDAMQDANKNFVPFYRVLDLDTSGKGNGTGKGFGVFNPIKKIKGSERAIIDPIESIIKNTYAYMALADRNEVSSRFVDLANKTDDPSQFIMKINTPIKGVTVEAAEMNKFLQSHGIDGVPEDLLTIFRAAQQPLAENEIARFVDGKREVYEVDPNVASVFKASDKEAQNWIFKIVSSPASFFRAGVTLSPDFFPRNLIRDQFSAFINSNSGFVPLLDTVRGAASMIGKDDAYQNWLKSGGANATMVALDRQYIQNSVMKLDQETGFRDSAWNVIKSPLEGLRIVSELAENATRLGEFKRSLGDSTNKSDIQQAGFNSREATLDFARIGSKVSAVNQLIAFFNAQVQDVDRFVRAAKADPVGVAVKTAASIVAPSVALWYANHDDPRYKNIPQWQKDLFWLVMTKDTVYRIPKPYGPGVLFGSGIERFLDYAVDKDPTVLEHYAKDLMQTFTPGTVPTFAAPMLEQWANKSFFTGNKIIPSSTEELLPQVQYQPYTTETAKALGKLVGTLPGENQPGTIASPAIIENYIRDWSGGLGMYTLQLADAGLRKTGVLPDPVMPAATLADTPFIKAFVVRYPSAGAQPIQDFYDEYTDHKQVISTIQYLAKQGDFASAVKLAKMQPDALVKMDSIKTGLSNAQRLIQLVTKNPTMSADDKRQLIDSTYYQMINMAHTGNDLMRNVDQVMAK